MKGCECVLEDIIFAEQQNLPISAVAGTPIELEYLRYSLLLRAKGAKWSLPIDHLPPLPAHVSRQGLFQLKPETHYIKREVASKEFTDFKRTGFHVTPGDTRIVYGAQGETFDAVVADMARPPRMALDTHWLACYVMISRARSIDGLLVLRPALLEELSRPPPKYLVDEIDRLVALEQESDKALSAYIAALPKD